MISLRNIAFGVIIIAGLVWVGIQINQQIYYAHLDKAKSECYQAYKKTTYEERGDGYTSQKQDDCLRNKGIFK